MDIWEEIGKRLKDLTNGEIACVDSDENVRFSSFPMSTQIRESVAVALHTKVRVSLSLKHEKVLILPVSFGEENGVIVFNGYDFSEDTFSNLVKSIVEDTYNSDKILSNSDVPHEMLIKNFKEDVESVRKTILEKLEPYPELLKTLHVFFENGASVIKTSKIMGIHRNTLLYRLNKIRDLTHLEPRNFKGAVILYLVIGQISV